MTDNKKPVNSNELTGFKIFGGSCEIRTHGGLLTLAGFQDRCIQPLCQASSLGALGRNRTGTDAMSERF